MSEVSYSELEMGLSSSDNPVEMKEDTVAFGPREVRAFHALEEVCGVWTLKPFPSLGTSSNSSRGLGFIFLRKRNKLAIFRLGKSTSMRPLSSAVLGFPSTLSLWSF